MSGEDAGERWSPAQRVESVLISILSLLDDAEVSSPANVDAGVLFRKDKKAFIERVKADVEKSKRDIPKDFTMPTAEEVNKPPPKDLEYDGDFWADSDVESFGGSDSDEEMTFDDDDLDEDDVDDEEEQEEDSDMEDTVVDDETPKKAASTEI
jgi:ubiquitin-conjugating enzyme E2 R